MPTRENTIWSYLAILGSTAFGLNWLWEMVQMPAYAEMVGLSWQQTVLPCTLATLGDTAITLAIFGVGALAAGRLKWACDGRYNVYLVASLLGAAGAVAYEWKALASGRWSYSEKMPIVPVLDVGLWPLMQLAALVPGAFWLANVWAARKKKLPS
jgi:hypothetical protein